MAYDPGGPHSGGPAGLSWGTQLFPNGELWLASNKMIERERGAPFIGAGLVENVFLDKARSAVSFAIQHLGLTFPCQIEMGLLGTADVGLAMDVDDITLIKVHEIIRRQMLKNSSDTEVNAALLAFFHQIHDATGFARPHSLF